MSPCRAFKPPSLLKKSQVPSSTTYGTPPANLRCSSRLLRTGSPGPIIVDVHDMPHHVRRPRRIHILTYGRARLTDVSARAAEHDTLKCSWKKVSRKKYLACVLTCTSTAPCANGEASDGTWLLRRPRRGVAEDACHACCSMLVKRKQVECPEVPERKRTVGSGPLSLVSFVRRCFRSPCGTNEASVRLTRAQRGG
jgi:hypothetical protein